MSQLRGAKLLLTASVAAAIIAFMPLVAFADEGTNGDDQSDPVTPITAAIDQLQSPLQALVSACDPGAHDVSVQVLPDENSDTGPTSLLVSYDLTNGGTIDATIDQDFVSSCVASTSGRLSAIAQADGQMVLQDTAAVLAIG